MELHMRSQSLGAAALSGQPRPKSPASPASRQGRKAGPFLPQGLHDRKPSDDSGQRTAVKRTKLASQKDCRTCFKSLENVNVASHAREWAFPSVN